MTPVQQLLRSTRESRSRAHRTLRSQIASAGKGLLGVYDRYSRKRKDSFSELFPWVIGDLHVAVRSDIEQLAPAWLALVAHVSIVDDFIDGDENEPRLLLLSSVLLAKSVEQIACKLPFGVMTKMLGASAIAEYQQTTNSGRNQKKLSIAKNQFVHIFDGLFISVIDRNLVNQLAEFAQLIDDIVDYDDDNRSGTRSQLTEAANSEAAFMVSELPIFLNRSRKLCRRLSAACAVNSSSKTYFDRMGMRLQEFLREIEQHPESATEAFRRHVPLIAQSS